MAVCESSLPSLRYNCMRRNVSGKFLRFSYSRCSIEKAGRFKFYLALNFRAKYNKGTTCFISDESYLIRKENVFEVFPTPPWSNLA